MADIAFKMMLLGTPGSGKGTLAQSLSQSLRLPHVSTGDIFRAAIRARTDLGMQVQHILDEGKLVPDELTCRIVFERLRKPDAQNGFILDGFPRTIFQAQALDGERRLDWVLLLELEASENIRRLTGRLICSACGEIYHLDFRPPQRTGICDKCNGAMSQRSDDRIEVVEKRLEEYHRLTAPLIEYYEKQQKIRRFSALQGAADLLCEVRDFFIEQQFQTR